MFYAIATMLNEETWQGILNQIPESQTLVSSRKIETQFPHFSWVVSQGIETERAKMNLKTLAAASSTFNIQSGGLGIFTGEEPVVTLILTRNSLLDKLQKEIWTACETSISDIKQTYLPDAWIPHITLLHHGIEKDEYCRFFELTMNKEIHFTVKVDNLAIIYRDGKRAGQIARYDLKKE